MKPATIEECVRDYIDAERAQIPVPVAVASRILHAVEVSRPTPRRPRLAFMRLAASFVIVLLIGVGIAWMRTAQMPAGTESGTWSSAASMAVPRAYHTATLLPNGKVLIVGGNQTPPNGNLPTGADPVSSVELYDPQTNSWSLAASMLTARALHTATLLHDGRVLVAGGTESSSDDPSIELASAELYDPAANTWMAAPPMASVRANHSATLLSDHRVLVIGGTDRLLDYPTGTAPVAGLNTAEFFDPT